VADLGGKVLGGLLARVDCQDIVTETRQLARHGRAEAS